MNRIDEGGHLQAARPKRTAEMPDIEVGMVQQRVLHSGSDRAFVFTATAEAKDYLLPEGTDIEYGRGISNERSSGQ